MTHDKIATFWIVMIGKVLKLWYAHTKAYIAERIRRHLDRYYRVGRHRTLTGGLSSARRASYIVAELRHDRELRHHQPMPV